MSVYTVSLQHLTEEFKLEMLFQASDFEKIQIIVEDVNRPALQLAGFFEHFEPARLQVIGLVEDTYLAGLTPEQRVVTFDRLFSFRPPALIFARGLEPCSECMVMARKHNITILRTEETTSERGFHHDRNAQALSGAKIDPAWCSGGGPRRGNASAGRKRRRKE